MNADEIGWFETIFKWLVGIVGLGIATWNGFIMSSISKNRDDIGSVKDLISKHELEDARNYVSKQDFERSMVDFKDTNKRIFQLVDKINETLLDIKKDK